MLKRTNNKGFTIIEVLIVLAIAGLIMLVVFLAVPALRRNAANSGRTNDAAKVSSAVTDCLSSHNGLAASCQTVAANSVDVTGLSQLTGTATFGTATASSGTVITNSTLSTTNDADASNYVVMYKAKCSTDGSGNMVGSSNTRDFAVGYNIKSSSGIVLQCIGS